LNCIPIQGSTTTNIRTNTSNVSSLDSHGDTHLDRLLYDALAHCTSITSSHLTVSRATHRRPGLCFSSSRLKTTKNLIPGRQQVHYSQLLQPVSSHASSRLSQHCDTTDTGKHNTLLLHSLGSIPIPVVGVPANTDQLHPPPVFFALTSRIQAQPRDQDSVDRILSLRL
jgi:hypothetical protein